MVEISHLVLETGAQPTTARDETHLQKYIITRPSTTTISSIPPEILTTIFEHACCGVTENGKHAHTTDLHRLLAVCSVCSDWRTIAFESGQLWRHIDFSSKEAADFMLQKCRNYPLIIDISFDKMKKAGVVHIIETLRYAVQECFTDETRIESINYTGTDSSINSFVSIIFQPTKNYTTSLSSLSIARSGSETHPFPFYLPRGLLNASMPNLRRLSISRCVVQWLRFQQVVLDRLEELELEKVPMDPSTFPCMKSLRTLYLIDPRVMRSHEIVDNIPASSNREMRFPSLNSFRLDATVRTYKNVLACMLFPPETKVDIALRGFMSAVDAQDAVISLLEEPNLIARDPSSFLSTLSISESTTSGYHQVDIGAWMSTSELTNSDDEPTIPPKLTLSIVSEPDSDIKLTEWIFEEMIDTPTLQCLIIKNMPSVLQYLCTTPSTRSSPLKHLCIDNPHTQLWSKALMSQYNSFTHGRWGMILPNLHSLTLRNAVIYPDRTVASYERATEFTDFEAFIPLSLLMESIRYQESGLLKRLRLVDCKGLELGEVSLLEELKWER